MMTALILIPAWLFLAWQTVKDFPNDGPQLRGWVWFVPFVPVVYLLLTITGLVMVVVGILAYGVVGSRHRK